MLERWYWTLYLMIDLCGVKSMAQERRQQVEVLIAVRKRWKIGHNNSNTFAITPLEFRAL